MNASGAFRSDYFSSSKILDDNSDFYGLTAQLKFLPALSEMFDGKLEARLTSPDSTHHDRTPSTTTLIEGTITMHLTQVDLTIGKQNVAWGRADVLNPTDNLTPRRYTVLLPFEEDQRFGTIALKIEAHLTLEHTVIIFTTPLFEPSIIPLPLPPGSVVHSNKLPARTFSNSELGLKLNKTGGETDWSVSYFHGFSLFPEIRFQGLVPTGLLIDLRYPEIDVVGADAARNFGRYGFRAEAAYISPKNYTGQERTMIQPYLFYVLGADRTLFENVNINLQLVGRWVPGFNDPETIMDPIERTLAVKNAILFGQRHRANYGLTSRISNKWFQDMLEAELLLVVYFNPLNSYVRPVVTYAFTDRLKGSIGGELFSGPQDSFFGLLESNRGVFTELRYTF